MKQVQEKDVKRIVGSGEGNKARAGHSGIGHALPTAGKNARGRWFEQSGCNLVHCDSAL